MIWGWICLELLKACWFPIFMCTKHNTFLNMPWVLSIPKDDYEVRTGNEKVDVRKWKTFERNEMNPLFEVTSLEGWASQRTISKWQLMKEGSLWKLKGKIQIFWACCWVYESLTESRSFLFWMWNILCKTYKCDKK